MSDDLLKRAIAQLDIPTVWRNLNLSGDPPTKDRAKFCSPLREDKHPSAALTDNLTRFHDYSYNLHFDSYDFYKAATQQNGEAFKPFVQLAGLGHELSREHGTFQKKSEPIDWESAVAQFNRLRQSVIVNQRGFSPDFVRWLVDNRLVGIAYCRSFNSRCIAFVVRDEVGVVAAAHCRSLKHDANGKFEWRFEPSGLPAFPLIIGDTKTASRIHIFEGQWDACAFLDKTGEYKSNDVAIVCTRAVSHWQKLKPLALNPKAEFFVWRQNDKAGRDWGEKVETVIQNVRQVLTPPEFKDLNNWTLAGATAEDIAAAIDSAKGSEPRVTPADETQTEPTVGGEYATEAELAQLLATKIPPVRCVGGDWYVYQRGIWQKLNRDTFRPLALTVQNARSRTSRKAAAILSHIEDESQCDLGLFKSFCAFDGDDILVNCLSGVLRIGAASIALESHSPDYLFGGQCAAAYDPRAGAETFEQVLQTALPDAADIDLFRLFSGTSFIQIVVSKSL